MPQASSTLTSAPVIEGFRSAMRRIAATVTVLTTVEAGRCHGMTATSMTSLSMDPPSLIVCLNRKTLLSDMMQSARRFCVNVLHADQADLSRAFSGGVPPEERFKIGKWDYTPDGIPFIVDAHTNIFCSKASAIPYGTHMILVGDVDDIIVREALKPLVYHDASYGIVQRADH